MLTSMFASVLVVTALFLSFPAHAFDCAAAASTTEKMICSGSQLKQADDAMSVAYFSLLRQTTDPEFHAALIRSQRRWIRERSRSVRIERIASRNAMLKVIRDRLAFLKSPEPINRMTYQRKIASKYSGGPFSGFEGGDNTCSIIDPPWGDWDYGCYESMHLQHKERICSSGEQWASGREYTYRLVSTIEHGQPRPLASCRFESTCPEDDNGVPDAHRHWRAAPPVDDELTPPTGPLWKYDPDIPAAYLDEQWLEVCLTAPVYPPRQLIRADPVSAQ